MLLIYLENKTRNLTMDPKHEEQIKPIIEEWQSSNSLVNLLGILAPAAFLAILLGHSGTFLEFLFNADYWKIKGPRCTKIQKKPQDIHFSKWLLNCLSRLKFRSDSKGEIAKESPRNIWRDGSILCNLVNMIVPGACKDPRLHRLQTPKHGQKLVYEYLDINPIFTPLELSQKSLSHSQEKKFSKYLNKIYQIIRKDNDNINNMKFSKDFVARGMGLVVAQQNKKSTFYIYPIPKCYPNTCDLDILIKGPYGNNGNITIPAISQPNQKCQPSTEYRRSLYMSSRMNSISPTLQGSSFLRKLSLSSDDTRSEIDIRVKLSATRIKVSYVPENTGIYEISLMTRGCHVVGSPYSVPVELATVSNYCSNDTDSEYEEEHKYIYRKKKVISRIVDFVDEKMLLKDDGTLVKIDDNKNSEKNAVSNRKDLNSNEILKTEENKVIKNTFKRNKNIITSILKIPSNEDLHLDTSKDENSNNQNDFNTNNFKSKHILNNDNFSRIDEFNEKQLSTHYEENNNYIETKLNKNLSKLSKTNNYLLQNIEEENNIKCLKINTNKNFVSASFTKVNDPQILNPNDPTLKSKVQDLQVNLKKAPRKDLKKENRVAEKSFKFSTSNNEAPIDNPSSNTLINDVIENPVLIKSNQSNLMNLKKMGQILENNEEHLYNFKNHVSDPIIDSTSNDKLGLVEKQKQFWIKKSTSLSNISEPVKYPKPSRILKSSFDSITSSENNKDKYIDNIVLPFEGIVENNIKLFEIKSNSESPTQKKTSFKIDIPKFNLNETIIVRNIEIVTKNEEDVIKLESLEERKSKFLHACNKPTRPKRTRNKINVIKDDCNEKKDDNNTVGCTKLNSINLEKNLQQSDAINIETNVSVRRKYRFKRAKLFFQSLEKPSNNSEKEEISEKHLGIISIKAESDINNIKEKTKSNNFQQSVLQKSNSDSENLQSSNKSRSKVARCESDPCLLKANQRTPVKLSERFQVTGLFQDVLEDSRFIGLPNKKAVVASLASLDTNSDPLIDHLNSNDINEIDYFENRKNKCNDNENSIPGYHKEFPHIPNKSQWKHRSRNNPDISGLIPGRKLLGGNVDNLTL